MPKRLASSRLVAGGGAGETPFTIVVVLRTPWSRSADSTPGPQATLRRPVSRRILLLCS
jgi:hypothetical protein